MHSPGVERASVAATPNAMPSQEAMHQPGAEGVSESAAVVLGSQCALGSPRAGCCGAVRDISQGL